MAGEMRRLHAHVTSLMGYTLINGTLNENAGIILGMGSVNEKRLYIVTSSLIGSADTQNDP